MLVDYHIHGMGHLDFPHTLESLAQFLEAAKARGIKEVGFAEHDHYLPHINFGNFAFLQKQFPDVAIRCGLEVEYLPGREKETQERLQGIEFDYLIGSVHYIGEWLFDHPDYIAGFAEWDLNRLYEVYFGLVAQMVHSGGFDIVGHFDLIKIFGHRPQGLVLELARPALEAVRECGLVLEVNTAGWHRPVQELYPAPELLREAFRRGIPVTLSSDAHAPEQVGRDLARARELLWGIGYRQIATFVRRQRFMVSL